MPCRTLALDRKDIQVMPYSIIGSKVEAFVTFLCIRSGQCSTQDTAYRFGILMKVNDKEIHLKLHRRNKSGLNIRYQTDLFKILIMCSVNTDVSDIVPCFNPLRMNLIHITVKNALRVTANLFTSVLPEQFGSQCQLMPSYSL